MKRNEITTFIHKHINTVVSLDTIRTVAGHFALEAVHGTTMFHDGGVIINEALDGLVLTVPKSQRKDYGVVSMTLPLCYVITTEAPKLPIPNGIYRGRLKDGSFTMIGYFDQIMVNLGCEHRSEIRIIDPFWIDLRTIKCPKYSSPATKAFEAEYEKRCLEASKKSLESKVEELQQQLFEISEERNALQKEIGLLKRDGLSVNDPSFDEFSTDALSLH